MQNRNDGEVVLTFDGLLLCSWPREESDNLAARFWRLPEIVPLDRLDSILDILSDSDGYTYHIKAVVAEQRRKRIEQAYSPPTIREIAMILGGGPPGGAADLQAVMLENLDVAQAMLRGSDVDWYRGFLREDRRHRDEEPCRDDLTRPEPSSSNALSEAGATVTT